MVFNFMVSNILVILTMVACIRGSSILNGTIRQTICDDRIMDCQVDEYCAGSAGNTEGLCTPIDYQPIINVDSASSTTESFELVVVTDIQYYYLRCKEYPWDECIFHTLKKDNPKKLALKAATARQKDCVSYLTSALPNVKAIVNAGDITNEGDATELLDYENEFHSGVVGLGFPMLTILGNHDYNKDQGYLDADRRRMINFLEDEIIALSNLQNVPITYIDFERSTPVYDVGIGATVSFIKGSFCYAVEIEGYVFIVMHWAAAINGGVFIDSFNDGDEYFDITSAENWMNTVLQDALTNSKKVILMPHSRRGLEKFIDSTNLKGLMARTVEAVICGHDHDQWGRYNVDITVGSGSNVNNIPVYYAGSASYQKLIVAEFGSGTSGLVGVTPYDTSVVGQDCSPTTDDYLEASPSPVPSP